MDRHGECVDIRLRIDRLDARHPSGGARPCNMRDRGNDLFRVTLVSNGAASRFLLRRSRVGHRPCCASDRCAAPSGATALARGTRPHAARLGARSRCVARARGRCGLVSVSPPAQCVRERARPRSDALSGRTRGRSVLGLRSPGVGERLSSRSPEEATSTSPGAFARSFRNAPTAPISLSMSCSSPTR